MAVQVLEQKALECLRLPAHFGAESDQGRRGAHGIDAARLHLRQRSLGGGDDVVHLRAQHAADGLVEQAPLAGRRAQIRVLGLRFKAVAVKQRHLAQLRQRDQAGAHAVVDVVRVIGNLVGQVAQLRLQTRLLAQQKALPYAARLGRFKLLGMWARAVLEDALARLKRQVQAVELRVALFQRIDHAQALQVVLKAALPSHAGVQRILPGVAKRRVAQVVRQRNGFDQILVDAQRARH